MFVIEVAFPTGLLTAAKQDALRDKLYALEGALQRNGQLLRAPVVYWAEGELKLVCETPEPDSIVSRHCSEIAWQELGSQCLGDPKITVLGKGAYAEKAPQWRRQACLYLFTHMFDSYSAVCAGSNGQGIPSYRFGFDDALSEELYTWTREYRRLDELWLS